MDMLKMKKRNIDLEKIAVTVGMTVMEAFGALMLLCAIFDIRIL